MTTNEVSKYRPSSNYISPRKDIPAILLNDCFAKSASRSFLSLSTIWFLLSYVALSSFLSAVLSISPFDQEYICIFYSVVPHLSLSILSVLLPVYIMFLCYLYIYPSLFQLFPLCLRPSTLFCLFNSLFLLSRYPLAFYK